MSQLSKARQVELAPIVPRKSAWLVGSLALACLLGGLWGMWRTYASRAQWAADDARIVYSDVVSFGDKAKPRYRLQVEFLYTIAGKRYVVPHSMPMTYPDRHTGDNDALIYGTGSMHRILYNKTRPYDIVLDRGSATQFYLAPLLFTAMGAVLSSGLALAYLRASRYSCAACGAGVEGQHAFCFHCGRRIPRRKGRMRE